MPESEQVNRGGRPVGSKEDPNSVSRSQVLSDAKLYKQMADDLKQWYQKNKDTMDLDQRLKCLNFLREAVIQGLKFHLAPAKASEVPKEPTEVLDAEAIAKEIFG